MDYIEKKLNELIHLFFLLSLFSPREIPNDDWAIFDGDETRNESIVVSLKTWFLENACRSCFFGEEEYWRDVDRGWGFELDRSLLKYTKRSLIWEKRKEKKITV